jgi:threonylcarbamoyladenosine tRNA methylthiotransferase MtaB
VEHESGDRPGYVRGTDRRYVPVEIPGSEADLGQLVNGVGEKTFDRFLRAVRTP